MNVAIIAVDKLRDPHIRAACDAYLARLKPYGGVDVIEVRKSTGADAPAREADSILSRITSGDDVVWALDRAGTPLDSIALARRIADVERSGRRRLALVIGGAEGLDERVIARADFRWALSPLTFLHEMARLIVLEQWYRAAKIARNEPYHR